jgi:hypothetical protein
LQDPIALGTLPLLLEPAVSTSLNGPGGMRLGRTPVQGIVGSGATVFELHDPRQQSTQRITIRFGVP